MGLEEFDDLPDVPLARAYKTVLMHGQEVGATVSSVEVGDHEKKQATELVAERHYNVPPEDLRGFAGGMAGWILSLPGLTPADRVQLALVNALMIGIQFERDRLAES